MSALSSQTGNRRAEIGWRDAPATISMRMQVFTALDI
jgi:hypothetical protein